MKANPADVPDPLFGVSRASKAMLAAVGLLLTSPSGMYLAIRSVAKRTAVGVISLLATFDGWRLLYGLTIFLLFCPTSNQQQLVTMGFYARYFAVGALAWWTYWRHRRQAVRLRSLSTSQRRLVQGLWLAVLVAALSATWSVDRLATVPSFVVLAFLAVIVHNLVTRRWTDTTRIPGDFAVAFTVLTAIFAASIAADMVDVPHARDYYGRLQGLYQNPNMLGMMCLLTLPVGWALYRHTRKKLYVLGMIPAAVALTMSQSRTSIFAAVVGAIWVVFRARRVVTARVFGVFAASVVVVTLSVTGGVLYRPSLFGSFLARFTANDAGDVLSGRLVGWRESLHLLQARPWTGYGYSAGPTLFASERSAGRLTFGSNVAHNSYLQWLLELGLTGLAPILLLLAVCVWAVLRGDIRGFGSGLVWTVLAGLLLQMAESAMFGTGQPYPFVFWLAVAAVLVRNPAGGRRMVATVGSDRVTGAETDRMRLERGHDLFASRERNIVR